jgi:hypothetical protein
LSININGTRIEQVEHTKFMGVIINSRLKWHDHVTLITKKVSKNIGIIRRISKTVTSETLLTLYRTLVHPYMDYCNVVWAAGHATNLNNLFRKQKKAIRLISYAKWNAHTALIFRKLRIMSVYNINEFQTACFVYRSIHGLLPVQFSSYFTFNNLVHDHNTRQSTKIFQLHHRTIARANSIKIYGTKVWNSLDAFIVESPTFSIFKYRCKNMILQQTNE